MSVFTVDLANQPGELARLCEAMAGRGINLVLSAIAREGGHGRPPDVAARVVVTALDQFVQWVYENGATSMRRHALPLQLHFLATRFASMRRMRGMSAWHGSRRARSARSSPSRKVALPSCVTMTSG